uniref:Tectonic-1-3 N-terminal domain-containing protein n=2 Tax=Lutzomyia longipalpis TaxID=7200 RepID=A0A1B0CUJ9_LUTLO
MKLFVALLTLLGITVVHGDRALVKIGVSKTTMAPVVTTESSSTTTTTVATTTTTLSTSTTTQSTSTTSTSKDNTTVSASSTTSTTTLAPPANATDVPDAKNQTTNATEAVKIPRRIRLQQEQSYYCKCDLKINVCDVDCCCDIDCTGDMLKLFDCHEAYISTTDYHTLHGLPSCRVSSSIFCVLRNNLHRYDYEEFDESLSAWRVHHWPDTIEETPADSGRDFYRLHDPIAISIEGAPGVLGIPLSLSGGGVCHVEESIKFLTNTHSTCLRRRDENFSMEYLTKLSSVEIPPKPDISCSEASNSCLAVEIFHCLGTQCLGFNVSDSPGLFPFNLMLKFTHNFTHIVKVEATAVEKTLPAHVKSHHQRIEVLFATVNESHSHTVSGNIGYLPGKPVIFSHIHSVNISEDKQESLIDYFHPNRTSEDEDYHMALPKSHDGLCLWRHSSSSQDTQETLNFAENQIRTCDIHLLDTLNITQETNFTEICRNFHRKILQYLLMFPNVTENLSTEELYVSEFGNPRNDTSNWIQIDLRGIAQGATIEGIFDATDDTITCRNMIIRAKHVYQFGRLEVAGNRHQALIERASVDFGPRVDLQFRISEDFRVPIFHVVSFVDLTHRVRNLAAHPLASLLLLILCLFGTSMWME